MGNTLQKGTNPAKYLCFEYGSIWMGYTNSYLLPLLVSLCYCEHAFHSLIWREIYLIRVANVYDMIHKRKIRLTNLYSNLCATFHLHMLQSTHKYEAIRPHAKPSQKSIHQNPNTLRSPTHSSPSSAPQIPQFHPSKTLLCAQMSKTTSNISLTHSKNLKYIWMNHLIHTDHITYPCGVWG